MSAHDIQALSPLIAVDAAAVVLVLAMAVRRSHAMSALIALGGFALAIALLPWAAAVSPHPTVYVLLIDRYALFYMGLMFATGFLITLLSYGYLDTRPCHPEEFYALLLLSTAGAVAMVAATHFISFYVSLELLSVALYGMIAYLCNSERSTEAGLKYLIMGGVASAFLLFGMAVVYAELGTMRFAPISYVSLDQTANGVVLLGVALIAAGLAFKLSLVPLHMWTPDVYEGSPAPVTAYIATVSKAAVLAALLRYFAPSDLAVYDSLFLVLSGAAIVSMLGGSLLALFQNNVKRILAYSSIAHMGYALVGFLAGGAMAVESVTYYLVAYVATTIGAFGVITGLSRNAADREMETVEDFRGLLWSRPWEATTMGLMLLSLAGVPLTAGFVGKFYVLLSAVHVGRWYAIGALVIASGISLYYYLRIVMVMCAPAADASAESPVQQGASTARTAAVVLAGIALAVVWLGIYPAPLIRWCQAIAAALT